MGVQGVHEAEFESRYAWRKNRQIYNLRELARLEGEGDFEEEFPGLWPFNIGSTKPLDALRLSIFNLWAMARECYVFGQFAGCILVCGAVAERSLKLEFESQKGQLPGRNGKATLGQMIGYCKGLVDPTILQHAQDLLGPRNSMAHALLEHSNPLLANLGGPERGIEDIGVGHLIEFYRGDANRAVQYTHAILKALYGQPRSW